ncbi:MAG: hypothetical protein ABSH17_00455 [Syntrophobacteraceae bacterium]
MIKRSAVVGIGFALLVIGLAGMVLLQTDVLYRPESKGQFGLPDVKPPGPSQEGPGTQAGLERRQLPGTPDGIKQTPEPGSQAEQVPAPQSGEAPRNPPLAGSKARPRPSPEALQPVVIRFHFDPAQEREINVAQVHLGDSISVRVRRLGQAYLGLYLAFAIPHTLETPAWRQWSTGSRRAAVAPIRDIDRIDLTADRDFGVALIRKLDSKEGAVLRLGADYPAGHNLGAPRGGPAGWGGYVIEMRIYPGNRWNIKPRGLV